MDITPGAFQYISKLVYDEAGIVLSEGKEYLVTARMAPVLEESESKTIEELVNKIQSAGLGSRKWIGRVVDVLTTNETSFYRDIQPFEALKKKIIPQLIKQRDQQRQLSIWCAACSTGQEPYTIAMTLRENFPELLNWKVQIKATDLSPTVIEKAKEGVYSQVEVNRGMPVAFLMKYFEKSEREWKLKDDIRKMVDFSEMNLCKPWPIVSKMDIIFIRNVLIYFNTDTKKEILANARKVLQPDGYMFLGAAETTLNLDDNFQRYDFPRAGCYSLKQ